MSDRKNSFLAIKRPDGPEIVSLMGHSNGVLEAMLLLAGRKLLTAKKLLDAVERGGRCKRLPLTCSNRRSQIELWASGH